MLVLDYGMIEFLCFYGMIIILSYIVRKYKGNSASSTKRNIVMFVFVFILENIEICLYVTPNAILESGMEITEKVSMIMNVTIYAALCMAVIIRVMIINTLYSVFYNFKCGRAIYYLFLLGLVISDVLGVVGFITYILSCMLLLIVLSIFHKPQMLL